MPQSLDISIDLLTENEYLRQCVEIQKKAWGFADEDVLPVRMLQVCARIGGQVLGARFQDGRVIGFVNAFPGYREGQVYLHSHMMGVLPEFQNLGVGRRLKWEQRREALTRGIRLIEWTFDPLEFRNARLNIELLGVICRKYLVNTYGITSSPLHGGLPTDRLVAEWHLDSPRVRSRSEQIFPGEDPSPTVTAVDLPIYFGNLKSEDPTSALQIQLEFRERMMTLLSQGLSVVRFELDRVGRRARYHLCSRVTDLAMP